jgi:hypothetical protein
MKVMSFTSATTSFGLRTALISLAALGACSDELACPEVERTIDHGVYGQVVYKQYQGPDTPFYDVLITTLLLNSADAITRRTRSDKDGFYEIALPDGEYMICTDFAASPCSSFIVDTIVRRDLVVAEETAVYWESNDFPDCL